MDAVNSHSLYDLIIARRLLMAAQDARNKKPGEADVVKTAKDAMEEDQAILSGKTPGSDQPEPTQLTIQDQGISLGDLIRQLKNLDSREQTTGNPQVQVTAVEMTTTIEEEFTFQYTSLEPVDGLVVRNRNLAETDRYAFQFSDSTTLKIIDKWSGKSTTIWGDPHVDVSDVAGNWDGDFKDLTGSDSHTTFMLQDGTRLTITAKDAGIIEGVDIYLNSQHVHGTGAGSLSFNEQSGLFSTKVDSATGSGLPMGDTIYAGGDGNDWYDSGKRLVWGKTTSPAVVSRPTATMLMEYRLRMEQTISVQQFTA